MPANTSYSATLSPHLLTSHGDVYLFFCSTALCELMFWHGHADSFRQHWITEDAHPQLWNLMVTLHLPNSIIHTNTLLHREPCCVLSGRTQMAATWCVLMGSCDGFGQDMDTHTDGDPLRVAGRWTCWLLICSDQCFTTWSSDTGRVAPTELAQWLGKHHCIYAGDKSTKF